MKSRKGARNSGMLATAASNIKNRNASNGIAPEIAGTSPKVERLLIKKRQTRAETPAVANTPEAAGTYVRNRRRASNYKDVGNSRDAR
jgi:hypothetical protein